jgi:nitrogen fixation protein FixH
MVCRFFDRTRLFLLLLLPLALLTACGSSLPALDSGQQRFQQEFADLTLTLDTAATPQINQPQIFRVHLTDSRGRPIEDADVYLKLDMDMLCLSDRSPVAEPIAGGTYQAASVYPMAGEWHVEVIADVAGSEHSATFELEVAEVTQ